MFGSHVSTDNSSVPSETVELSDGDDSTVDQIGSPSGTEKPIKTSRRQGNKKRNSCTIEFKVQTLTVLDRFTENSTEGKFKKVAEKRGIPSKSLIIKWNKQREQLFSEVELNKGKKNRGNIREVRQRRKMPSNKPGKGKRYPQAARLVVAEFKLRRARGSKVSKF